MVDPVSDSQFACWMAQCVGASVSLESQQTYAVAVSGGADSMALVLLAKRWADAQDGAVNIVALTVDHALREESRAEAEQVSNWLAARNIKHHIISLSQSIDKNAAVQAQARALRYDAMEVWCNEAKAEALLVAHHGDDQRETLLLRLIGGSGPAGLAGMRGVTTHRTVPIYRPLLSASKQALITMLQEAEQQWVEDPSNQSVDYARNRVRPISDALQAEGLTVERVSTVTNKLQKLEEYLTRQVAQWMDAHVTMHDEGYITLPLSAWKCADEFLLERVALQLIAMMRAHTYPVRQEKLQPLLEWLLSANKPSRRTLGGCIWAVDVAGDELRMTREANAAENLTLRASQPIEKTWDGRFQLSWNPQPLVGHDGVSYQLTSLGEKGRLWLLHSADERSISAIKALPILVSESLPALMHLENVVAVPHIGYWSTPAQEAALQICLSAKQVAPQ